MPIDPTVLRSMPKVELHAHLEGSLRPSTLIDLARHHAVELPSTDPSELYHYDDLVEFLRVYEIACSVLVTRDDFERVTYEALEDAARSSNVRYREMFFNPTLHDTSYPTMLAGIVDGITAAEADFGIMCRLIPSIYRQDSVATAVELVETIVACRDDHVVGIGMDGDELTGPPEMFAEAYEVAGRAGLWRTAHAAHDADASTIETCLGLLGCDRVDHGYHVIDDPALMERCAETGVVFSCATGTPPLCGWSTDIDESPIRQMIDAGLTVVLNSDDPAMFHTDLGNEFVMVCNGWELSAERTRRFVTDSIAAAWCDESERADLNRTILPELDRMLGLATGTSDT